MSPSCPRDRSSCLFLGSLSGARPAHVGRCLGGSGPFCNVQGQRGVKRRFGSRPDAGPGTGGTVPSGEDRPAPSGQALQPAPEGVNMSASSGAL